jgi:hypothetical protein
MASALNSTWAAIESSISEAGQQLHEVGPYPWLLSRVADDLCRINYGINHELLLRQGLSTTEEDDQVQDLEAARKGTWQWVSVGWSID